ncbi:MAG: hypothetical protein ACRDP6_33810 [Actinoallomurus sp.]
MGPMGPPPGRKQTGPIVAGAVLVVILLAGGVLYYASRGDDSPGAKPGTPSAASARKAPSAPPAAPPPSYATMPNPCTAVGDTLPADVRSVKPHPFEDTCRWEQLRGDRSRSLEVELKLEKTDPDPGLATSGTDAAIKDFADDLAYAANQHDNGGYQQNPARFKGLGDEAYAARAFNLISAGRTEATAISYDMGGAAVEVRKLNVTIAVKWRGGDYPPSVRGRRKLKGSVFPYEQAKRQAIEIVKAVMSKLS